LPLSQGDVESAQQLQTTAAQAGASAVRLVAGPGTGKSATIEERFRWLYADQSAHPTEVFGVSFTRAASRDLKLRVARHCNRSGIAIADDDLRITTLHSLALSILARANMLNAYPVRPRVLDEWEVEHIFDAELAAASGWTPSRCEEVRTSREAFWSTGNLNPANYIQPDPPITDDEQNRFLAFHGPTTQTYAGVLPGEIVRLCVDRIEAGLLAAADLMGMQHLVVDEYQDLNPIDLQFVDRLSEEGVSIFVAGDDDQSIYSFRFASPGGIQDFPDRHPGAGDHFLEGCFRCASDIEDAANKLINNFSPTSRIPKELVSLWKSAAPPVRGVVHRWRFAYYNVEAVKIAESCRALIETGVSPEQIMILLSNKRIFGPIQRELKECSVPFSPLKEESWRDTDAGRFALGVLRTIANEADYLALRAILGCPRGVGALTCARIVERSTQANLRYRDLFYAPLPAAVFDSRQTRALDRARAVCGTIAAFTPDDAVEDRKSLIRALLVDARDEHEAQGWDAVTAHIPGRMTLAELRDYLWADNSEQQRTILSATHQRIGLDPPAAPTEPGVRAMTMHGAKGLQADVVFIPALEDEILPGPKRGAVPGLVLEAARLLYVSMTRGRAALILSMAKNRYWSGQMREHTPSRYASHVAGAFAYRTVALSADEAQSILSHIDAMEPDPPPAD
jgi:DNA helicase-2/ATP-dependent DNA helicase PcrA